jgi:ribonuclease HII
MRVSMEMYKFLFGHGAIISDTMNQLVAGIDEVGRGPIAGPVCVGMVMMKKKDSILLKGIKDSKKLSEKKREEWFLKIKKFKKEGKLDFTYKMIAPGMIDEIGINPAINLAICRACKGLAFASSAMKVLLDGGLRAPAEFKNQKTIIKGDEKIHVISAASVVAKVMRDRLMVRLARKHPEYGFERHKGYGTKEHYKNIEKYGLISEHRKSYLLRSQKLTK